MEQLEQPLWGWRGAWGPDHNSKNSLINTCESGVQLAAFSLLFLLLQEMENMLIWRLKTKQNGTTKNMWCWGNTMTSFTERHQQADLLLRSLLETWYIDREPALGLVQVVHTHPALCVPRLYTSFTTLSPCNTLSTPSSWPWSSASCDHHISLFRPCHFSFKIPSHMMLYRANVSSAGWIKPLVLLHS